MINYSESKDGVSSASNSGNKNTDPSKVDNSEKCDEDENELDELINDEVSLPSKG